MPLVVTLKRSMPCAVCCVASDPTRRLPRMPGRELRRASLPHSNGVVQSLLDRVFVWAEVLA